jgi:2-oxoisovalerate dehydrogenase E1 component
MDRADIVHGAFRRRLAARDFPAGAKPAGALAPAQAVALYRAACLSRALDRVSRDMQRRGEGFYTIGSSGHENMAAVAAALRPTDMAFLHYRDAAFQIARAAQVPGQTVTWDMLLSFASSAEDPISGGRHKVLGSRALAIPPQTSTIASHLPKAVGLAYAATLARRLMPPHSVLPDDAVVMCSFGDASANHSTAQGAFNTASWTAYQGIHLPILFVCEDNGIGISTRTPKGWIAARFSQQPKLAYFACDGTDLYDSFRVATDAAAYVRTRRRPAFLHFQTVRLYGHAGADVPTTYLPVAEVEATEAQDPLLHAARLLHEAGALAPEDALGIYDETLARVQRVAEDAIKRPRLRTAAQVMASIVPPSRDSPSATISVASRDALFGTDREAMRERQPLGRIINWTLADLMLRHPEIILMGEDIGRKGGVYGVTQKLATRFGPDRVIDTILDEQSILGLALGLAHNGFIPIPEIQFLAYLHNAEDQLRGEAATLPFFSNGQFTNPMVIRVAGLGYQKGFGGHFHNDNAIGVLRDIPGIVVACPSNAADAPGMLRECVRLAREEQRVVVFLEPIALYAMRDLLTDKDGAWMAEYSSPDTHVPFGSVGVSGGGDAVAIVSFGNGYYLSRKAGARLAAAGIPTRSVDLRWLVPLPEQALLDAIEGCRQVLLVDECRRAGGPSEALSALIAEKRGIVPMRLTAEDSFIATGPAYAATLPSADAIIAEVTALAGRNSGRAP